MEAVGDYLMVCDHSGAWASHVTYSPSGEQLSYVEWNYISPEFVYSEANDRLYFFTNHSPRDLVSELILPDGTLGNQTETPTHSSAGYISPIRISPDGSRVVLGSGRIYDALTLEQVDSLSNDIADATWLGSNIFSIVSEDNDTTIQKWGDPNLAVVATRKVTGSPIRLYSTLSDLVLITSVGGVPTFSLWDSDLDVPNLFNDGFESEDTSAWSVTTP